MKSTALFFTLLLLALLCSGSALAQTRTVHVYVALCDNENQGIVPTTATLGNGQNPRTNLYWGAAFGIKTFFSRDADWQVVQTTIDKRTHVLDAVLFKHATQDVYLLAEAWDGKFIKETTKSFLEASAGRDDYSLMHDNQQLHFGGRSDLVAYIGHDGLMDFELPYPAPPAAQQDKDAIILACVSKGYFSEHLRQTQVNPLVWTTGLMAPEAYTLEAALAGWVLNETDAEIRERAAAAYHKYQKCGMKGARGLLVTGF